MFDTKIDATTLAYVIKEIDDRIGLLGNQIRDLSSEQRALTSLRDYLARDNEVVPDLCPMCTRAPGDCDCEFGEFEPMPAICPECRLSPCDCCKID